MQGRKFAMSVDVEDYYQVAAFDKLFGQEKWCKFESRVLRSTLKVLDIFDANNVKGTFFVLGCVAKEHPEIVREIVSRGHELASHGFNHQKVTTQNPDEFKEDVCSSKALLEDMSGKSVIGYRAPSFSISEKSEWAFDILADSGYLYSSSTYPIAHDHYGSPNWPTEPYRLDNGLLELPQATIEIANRRIPVGGGGYFRLFPYIASKFFIGKFQTQHPHPYMFYFHPWEIDPEQPVIKGAGIKSQFRHRVNLNKMEAKVAALCADFDWTTISNAYSIVPES
jgi:polysaccharide deacetylase family protein (PEP-CTERM system associated)